MRALVAAFATLLLPATAATAATPAERFPADGADIFRAVSIGAAYWQGAPCKGNVALSWGRLEMGTRGEASWQNFEDAWTNPVGNFDCRIVLNEAMPFDWPDLCTTVVHEMGHLLGRQHSHDERDVMYESAVDPIAECGGGTAEARSAQVETATRTTTTSARRKRCGRRRTARTRSAPSRAAHRACQRQRRAALRR